MSETELELAGPLEAVFKDPETVRQNIKIFRESLTKLLDPKVDMNMIHGKLRNNKSAWNVINQYWGVDTEPLRSWVTQLPDGEFAVNVAVRAFKGRNSAGRSGTCTSLEMKEKHKGKDFAALYSYCHGMAETRGMERACSALFMDADVSAEEVEGSPGPMQKNGEDKPKKTPGVTICECEDNKVQLSKDGRGCIRCQRLIDETKRKRIWETRGLDFK